jgi:flagellar motor switch protein FliG
MKAEPSAHPPKPPAGLRKAAILVLAVGDELAREVFTRLSEAEIRQLGETASSLRDVSREEVARVLLDFKSAFRGGEIPQDGAGSMFQLMVERALGEDRARDLLATEDVEQPFAICMEVEADALAEVLLREHPQTTAVVLASIEQAQAGNVLDEFEPEYAADVVYRMARLGHPSEEIKRDISKSLSSELANLADNAADPDEDPEESTVGVLKTMGQDVTDQLFDVLEARDAKFAREMRSKMFSFDDLVALDSRSMQRLLREVDSSTLARAMKGAAEALEELIYASMSSRAAEMLQDDLAAMGPMRITEVEEAQEAVVEVAMRLEEEGVLAIPRGGDGDFV